MPVGRCGRLGLGCSVSSSLHQREPGLLSYKLFTVSPPARVVAQVRSQSSMFWPDQRRGRVRNEPAGARAGEGDYRRQERQAS